VARPPAVAGHVHGQGAHQLAFHDGSTPGAIP
jgi:hypothetical protein